MDNEKLLKLTAEKNELIKSLIKDQQDSDRTDLAVVRHQDIIDKKRIDRARLRLIKKLLADVYSIIDKLEDDTSNEIVKFQLLIDESYL